MEDVATLLEEYSSTEAGKALISKGFRAVHQGGGLVNFEAVRDGKLVTVVAAGDDYAPREMGDAVTVLTSETNRDSEPGELGTEDFMSLEAYLASLE